MPNDDETEQLLIPLSRRFSEQGIHLQSISFDFESKVPLIRISFWNGRVLEAERQPHMSDGEYIDYIYTLVLAALAS